MDPYSSGEDHVIKTRKPYTITKQRERWTEEEHDKFLDALKLYGRAWQKIQEHIGTKTAVQIRSHAQKFFTKLQKEANNKGVPVAHAIDIEIPPPRPKRKPCNPYPRKISVGAGLTPRMGVKNDILPSPISSSCQSRVTVDLEKEPEEPCEEDWKLSTCNDKYVHCKRPEQSEHLDKLSSGDVVLQNYPRNVPVHILDGSLGMSAPPSAASGSNTNQDCSSPSRPSFHHSFSSYHPILSHIQNQDDYLQISSMFSSLVVSALSQAGFSLLQTWPTCSSPTLPSTPSMEAIAAATVAAATAWWAANGLLPFYPSSERTDQDLDQQQCSEPLHEKHEDSVLISSPVLSLESEDAKHGLKSSVADAAAPADDTEKEGVNTVELNDANKSKKKNLIDRSSCGSNTASGSEVDAYASEKVGSEEPAILDEKHVQQDKESAIHTIDPCSRRCRNTTNMNVSEEGRLAFRALFSRQRLPQSFSPPHDVKNKGRKIPIKENGVQLDIDLNGKPLVITCPQKPEVEENDIGCFKVKAGFKPYKRCSIEAKGNREEEKESKRLRIEGNCST